MQRFERPRGLSKFSPSIVGDSPELSPGHREEKHLPN